MTFLLHCLALLVSSYILSLLGGEQIQDMTQYLLFLGTMFYFQVYMITANVQAKISSALS